MIFKKKKVVFYIAENKEIIFDQFFDTFNVRIQEKDTTVKEFTMKSREGNGAIRILKELGYDFSEVEGHV